MVAMLIRGEALIATITLSFAIHGERNAWNVTVTAPGGVVNEADTHDATPYAVFNEMLAEGYEAAMRHRSPARAGEPR
jgi:hypothetical protein